MRCVQCQGQVNECAAILVTADGDFVCSGKCEETWKLERDRFFNETIFDDKKMAEWWAA